MKSKKKSKKPKRFDHFMAQPILNISLGLTLVILILIMGIIWSTYPKGYTIFPLNIRFFLYIFGMIFVFSLISFTVHIQHFAHQKLTFSSINILFMAILFMIYSGIIIYTLAKQPNTDEFGVDTSRHNEMSIEMIVMPIFVILGILALISSIHSSKR